MCTCPLRKCTFFMYVNIYTTVYVRFDLESMCRQREHKLMINNRLDIDLTVLMNALNKPHPGVSKDIPPSEYQVSVLMVFVHMKIGHMFVNQSKSIRYKKLHPMISYFLLFPRQNCQWQSSYLKAQTFMIDICITSLLLNQ